MLWALTASHQTGQSEPPTCLHLAFLFTSIFCWQERVFVTPRPSRTISASGLLSTWGKVFIYRRLPGYTNTTVIWANETRLLVQRHVPFVTRLFLLQLMLIKRWAQLQHNVAHKPRARGARWCRLLRREIAEGTGSAGAPAEGEASCALPGITPDIEIISFFLLLACRHLQQRWFGFSTGKTKDCWLMKKLAEVGGGEVCAAFFSCF